jgi:hypothetical protein
MSENISIRFPDFFSGVIAQNNPLWLTPFTINDLSQVEVLFKLYDQELELLNNNTEEEIRITTLLVKDIINLQDKLPEFRDDFEFLQFKICTRILNILGIKKLSHYQFDWIANTISSEITVSIERTVEMPRIARFITSDSLVIKKYFEEDFFIWTKNVFYYCRTTGGHKEIIKEFMEFFYEWFINYTNIVLVFTDHVMAVIEIQAFAYKNKWTDLQKELSNILMYYFNGLQERNLLFYIAFQFSCLGWEHTPYLRTDWCEKIEKEFSDLLVGHCKLHLVINKYSNDYSALISNLDELDLAIKEYHAYLGLLPSTFQEIKYELSRIFSLFEQLNVKLLEIGEVEAVLQIFKKYFSINEADFTRSKTLVIIPNTAKGVLYSQQNYPSFSNQDPLIYVPEFIQVYNNFLGLTHAIDDDFEIPVEKPSKHASVPDPSFSNDYEKLLHERFLPVKKKILNDVKSYFLYSSYQIPLQTLLIKYFGIGISINQSFTEPLKSRKISNVLIWQGDCFLSETECNVVQEIFENAGIKVKRLSFHSSTKAEFIENYRMNAYDLVWVSCHGEFDHYHPQNSYLVLDQDKGPDDTDNHITYEELNTTVIAELKERRLLVLNACDGATTSLTNSPISIGLGASMANKNQSLISHQWPIDDLAGTIYGIILSHHLTKEFDYLEAYRKTVLEFLKGRNHILSLIQSISKNQDIIDRINNKEDIPLDLIYYWGSLSFII